MRAATAPRCASVHAVLIAGSNRFSACPAARNSSTASAAGAGIATRPPAASTAAAAARRANTANDTPSRAAIPASAVCAAAGSHTDTLTRVSVSGHRGSLSAAPNAVRRCIIRRPQGAGSSAGVSQQHNLLHRHSGRQAHQSCAGACTGTGRRRRRLCRCRAGPQRLRRTPPAQRGRRPVEKRAVPGSHPWVRPHPARGVSGVVSGPNRAGRPTTVSASDRLPSPPWPHRRRRTCPAARRAGRPTSRPARTTRHRTGRRYTPGCAPPAPSWPPPRPPTALPGAAPSPPACSPAPNSAAWGCPPPDARRRPPPRDEPAPAAPSTAPVDQPADAD